MRIAPAVALLCLAAGLAAAEPVGSIRISAGGQAGVDKPLKLTIYLNYSGDMPFRECSLALELPEGLRAAGEPAKRTYVVSGEALLGARLDVQLTPHKAGEHTVSTVATWGQLEARAMTTILVAAEPQGPNYVLTTATNSAGEPTRSLRGERLPLKQAAQLLSKATGMVFEIDPTYAGARVNLNWSGRDELQLARILARARLTYARTPDGKHILRPAVGESMNSPTDSTVRKTEDGQFYISGYRVDSLACLDLLFKVAGIPYEIRDTLTAFPIRLESHGQTSFEEALGQLCRQAGWQWTREEEKYIISLKK